MAAQNQPHTKFKHLPHYLYLVQTNGKDMTGWNRTENPLNSEK
jgi:hypothetical protein